MIAWLGGHWIALQSLAWVGMAFANSRALPLRAALAVTFDGKHPCQICKFVRDGKQAEEKKSATEPAPKIEFYHSVASDFEAVRIRYPMEPFLFAEFSLDRKPPPTPPPNQLPG